MSEDLNGNFSVVMNRLEQLENTFMTQVEHLENVLVKINKRGNLVESDLNFKSSLDLLYGKPEKSGRYGILKKEKDNV